MTSKIKLIQEWNEILEIREDWLRLWRAQVPQFPFMHPLWILNWYEHFSEDSTAVVFTLSSENRIVAIAPMMILRRAALGFPAGALMFAVYHSIGYSEVLAESQDWRDRLISGVLEIAGGKIVFLQNVRNDSPTLRSIVSLTSNPKNKIASIPVPDMGSRTPFTDMAELRAVTLPNLSAHRRSKSRYYLKQTENIGVYFEFDKIWSEQSLTTFRMEAISLLNRELLRKGKHNIFCDERLCLFLEKALIDFHEAEMLRLFTARRQEKLVAFRIHWVVDRIAYDWMTAFDYEFERQSIGSVLLEKVILELAQSDLTEIDMMRGDYSYKYRWASKSRDLSTYAVKCAV